jgi:hypothetical protein
MSAWLLAESARDDAATVMAQLALEDSRRPRSKRHAAGVALGDARALKRHADKLVSELERVAGTDRQYEGQD